MILSGREIKRQTDLGNIWIYPFDGKRLNPNSYNLRLAPELLEYTGAVLDMAEDNKTQKIIIPPEGLILWPGRLYLGSTIERTETRHYVPMLEGRSSVGRLGMFIHVTAGFGDIGFSGRWTLEIQVIKPLRIYAGTEVCQIYFHTVEGEKTLMYDKGKYSGADEVQASRMWREFREDG